MDNEGTKSINERCIVCGSDDYSIVKDKLRHDIKINVIECENCGLQLLQNPKKLDYDKEYRVRYTPIYGKEFTPKELFDLYLTFQQYKIEDLQKQELLNKEMAVLDVGCASGYFLKALEPHIKEGWGVDIRKADVDFAVKNGINAHVGPLEKTKIPRNYFDLVTVIHTLEHAENPLLLLKEIKPFMKEDAKIYITVPNLDDAMLTLYKNEKYADWWYEEPHRYYFDQDTLSTLCERAGFKGNTHAQQRVNFMNHINWKQTGEQEKWEKIRMDPPVLLEEENNPIAKEINDLMKWTDDQYRIIMQKHHVADNLVYAGWQELEYWVDIDGVLCHNTWGDYEKAEPKQENIDKINAKHDKGIKIILWTARGSKTGVDWRKVTEAQMKKWGVKYDELRLDKPHFDKFIDDKNEKIEDL